MSGNQGNEWHEAFFQISELNQDFYIIIEATSGFGLISDIAIDDFEIMQGADCSLGEITTTTDSMTDMFGVLDMQSCANRCKETESQYMVHSFVNEGNIEVCDCDEACVERETCCMDYFNVCTVDDSTIGSSPTTSATATTKTTTVSSTRAATSTPSTTTSSTTPSTTTTTTTTTTSSTTPSTTSRIPSTIAAFLPNIKPTTTIKATSTTTPRTTTKPKPTAAKITKSSTKSTKKITARTEANKTILPAKSIVRIAEKTNGGYVWKLFLLGAALLATVTALVYTMKRRIKPGDVPNIQFNTQYYKKHSEEPLIRSTSFAPGDAIAEEATEVDEEHATISDAGGETTQEEGKGATARRQSKKTNAIHLNMRKRNSERGEFSDTRLLTLDDDDDGDDDQMDFSLQSD